eukprot:5270711-Prymnesium_polylepis.2
MLDSVAGGPGIVAERWVRDWQPLAKPEIAMEIARAMQPGFAASVAEAEHRRQKIESAATEFMGEYDVLLLPTISLPPFDKAVRYPAATGGAKFDDYVGWMLPCSAISLTNLPALSLPVGTTSDGLPLAVQLVGRPDGEAALLVAAALLERAIAASTPVADRHLLPRDPAPAPQPPRAERCTGPRTVEEAAAHHRVAVTGESAAVARHLEAIEFPGVVHL